ncbi:hypothetical protein ACX1G9_12965 [Yersinia enterocolitica]
MKTRLITLSLLVFIFSGNASENKEDIKSLVDEMRQYITKGASSPFDACKSIASSMVSKYGPRLSELGKTPSEVRDSSLAICLDALSQVETAQSQGEISMWKTAALKNIDMQFKNDSRGPVPKEYLIDSIDKSSKLATLLFLSMHADDH